MTDIFYKEDTLEIMEKYFIFLTISFATLDKIHLCSIAVKNQVVVMFGGKTYFDDYLENIRESSTPQALRNIPLAAILRLI